MRKLIIALLALPLLSIGSLRAQDVDMSDVVFPNEDDEYVVRTPDEFLTNLGSGRTLSIPRGVHINLTDVLDDDSRWNFISAVRSALSEETAPGELLRQDVGEGHYQLILKDFEEIIIRGEGGSSITLNGPNGIVISLWNCSHIEFVNLTLCHTLRDEDLVEGEIIRDEGGFVNGLMGCELKNGSKGVFVNHSRNFHLESCIFTALWEGYAELNDVEAFRATSCDFSRGYGEGALFFSRGSILCGFSDCRVFASDGDARLFDFDEEFFLDGCKIYHPSENLGSMDLADRSLSPNLFIDNPFDPSISGRSIGTWNPRLYSRLRGRLDGRITVDIAWEEDDNGVVAGYIIYPNSKAPAPILLVGQVSLKEDLEFLRGVGYNKALDLWEYQSDGSVTGKLFLAFEDDGQEIRFHEGFWENPKSGDDFFIQLTGKPTFSFDEGTLPSWYPDDPLLEQGSDAVGGVYRYSLWNPRTEMTAGGYCTFTPAGQDLYSFAIFNDTGDRLGDEAGIASGSSAPDRPAVVSGGRFEYAEFNSSYYGFNASFYQKFVVLRTTSDPDTRSIFGLDSSFDGIYIKQ